MKEFNRIEIKKRADAAFMSDYWPLVGFTALYMGILTVVGSVAGMSSYISSGVNVLFDDPVFVVLSLLTSTSIAIPVALLFSGPLQASMMWLYYRVYSGEKAVIGDIFYVFRDKGRWVKTFTTVLLVNLFTTLWSLLFFIPGIIKGISYSLAPYIILDDPSLTPSQAIQKSKELTEGHKGQIFGLHMSFLGWLILSSFTFDIAGMLWVYPYYYISIAGIYDVLRDRGTEAAETAKSVAALPIEPLEVPQEAQARSAKSFGIISLGHGVMSLCLSASWGFGVPFGIAGMIMSSKSGEMGYEGGFKKAGFITSLIGSVVGVVITIIYTSLIAGMISLMLSSFDFSKPFDFDIDKFGDKIEELIPDFDLDDLSPELDEIFDGLDDFL